MKYLITIKKLVIYAIDNVLCLLGNLVISEQDCHAHTLIGLIFDGLCFIAMIAELCFKKC